MSVCGPHHGWIVDVLETGSADVYHTGSVLVSRLASMLYLPCFAVHEWMHACTRVCVCGRRNNINNNDEHHRRQHPHCTKDSFPTSSQRCLLHQYTHTEDHGTPSLLVKRDCHNSISFVTAPTTVPCISFTSDDHVRVDMSSTHVGNGPPEESLPFQ